MLNPVLLKIAKSVILSKFDYKISIDKKNLMQKHPFLATQGAAFVTLKYKQQLRGCIGSIIAHRILLDDIIHNAQSAAFSDPRFNPLEKEEFPSLLLEVSVLTAPKILEYKDFEDLLSKVKPNVDGLILQYNSYQGTFLPQVWEQLPNPKDFLQHLSQKAGTNPSIYAKHPTIYRYSVDAIEDKFDAILPL